MKKYLYCWLFLLICSVSYGGDCPPSFYSPSATNLRNGACYFQLDPTSSYWESNKGLKIDSIGIPTIDFDSEALLEGISGDLIITADNVILSSQLQTSNCWLTPEGGYATLLINNTGSASVKGSLLEIDHLVDGEVKLSDTDTDHAVCVMYSDGVADGQPVWVVVAGVAEILIEDSTSCIVGNWVKSSNVQGGRIDATNLLPPGSGVISEIQEHFKQIGHCLETKSSGTDVLTKVILHFN